MESVQEQPVVRKKKKIRPQAAIPAEAMTSPETQTKPGHIKVICKAHDNISRMWSEGNASGAIIPFVPTDIPIVVWERIQHTMDDNGKPLFRPATGRDIADFTEKMRQSRAAKNTANEPIKAVASDELSHVYVGNVFKNWDKGRTDIAIQLVANCTSLKTVTEIVNQATERDLDDLLMASIKALEGFQKGG